MHLKFLNEIVFYLIKKISYISYNSLCYMNLAWMKEYINLNTLQNSIKKINFLLKKNSWYNQPVVDNEKQSVLVPVA